MFPLYAVRVRRMLGCVCMPYPPCSLELKGLFWCVLGCDDILGKEVRVVPSKTNLIDRAIADPQTTSSLATAAGSSIPAFATLCLEALMPHDIDIDLVLVDYNPNLYAGAQVLEPISGE